MALPRANLLEECIIYRPLHRQQKPKLISSCKLLQICATVGICTLFVGAIVLTHYVFQSDQHLTEGYVDRRAVTLPQEATVPLFTCSPTECLPLWLYKENCDRVHNTGSAISQVERNMIVEHINGYRAKINNNCAFLHGPVPPASNYRKVKYSCELESRAKFECSANMTFESDKYTWRKSQLNVQPRLFSFCSQSKWFNTMSIDPKTQTVRSNDEDAVFIKLFVSEDVTEVGCHAKLCDGIEYIACITNHNSELPDNFPLYTPGQRCNTDSDCTLPGYHVCDATVGLCDYKSHRARKMEAYPTRCDYLLNIVTERGAEPCHGTDTGSELSDIEREATVFFVNSFRKLINNDCDFGKGVIQHISNYRKVKYSCALEAESKFECVYAALKTFKSDKYTFRAVAPFRNTSSIWSNFLYFSKWDHKKWLIDSYNQISLATEETNNFLRLTISPNVTEIGCYFKTCGNNEYLACKTGHVVASLTNAPLCIYAWEAL